MIRPFNLKAIAQPTPEMVSAELQRLGLSASAAGQLLRINPRTVQRYTQQPGTAGATPCPFPVFALLRLMHTQFSLSHSPSTEPREFPEGEAEQVHDPST